MIMIIGEPWEPKTSCFCLTDEENPRRKLIQETYPNRGSNPGPLRDGAHATACSTAVGIFYLLFINLLFNADHFCLLIFIL